MSLIDRLRSMDAEELRSRLACEFRKAAGLVRHRVAPRTWRRADLANALAPPSTAAKSLLAARSALAAGDWHTAHVELAQHFTARQPRFPLDPRTLPDLVRRIRPRFPDAAADAMRRADAVLAGKYDLLGYEAIPFGTPPAWHSDPIHGREAPLAYWSSLRYLDPELGDHKIIWELNRHQYWLGLGRAHRLTDDGRYYRAAVEHLESWIAANPPYQGINWASMLELGFRTISWTWALHFFAAAAADDRPEDAPWIVDLLLGLDCQLQHIEDNLSRYFSPNTHLLGEALALYVVSAALPELRNSERRAALGRRVLIDEIRRQILDDGGHAERSAHYHRYTTDFYLLALLCARITGDPAAGTFEAAARQLAVYLRTITDDQGGLPLIGDDDGGQLFPVCGRRAADCRDTLAAAAAILGDPALLVSDIPEEAFWLCGMLPLDHLAWPHAAWPSKALPQSGYYVARTSHGDHLVFDAGRHGFLNGGHAHADALSVVLTVGGCPLLVDSGTATYTMDAPVRDRFRATAMHNTVVVNGRPQSEPRGPFHWRRSTDARAPLWQSHPAFEYAEGNHDGYAPVVHSRSVLAVHGFGWIIIDHLLGDGSAAAEAFWHLHPNWTPLGGAQAVTLRHCSAPVVASVASSVPLEILTPATASGLDAYSPVYGFIERGTCLRARFDGVLPFSFATFVTRNRGPQAQSGVEVEVTQAPLAKPAPGGWHSAAFRVVTGGREALALACVERAPGATAAGPGAMWGSDEARTDARLALVYLNGPPGPAILVEGSRVESSAGLVRA